MQFTSQWMLGTNFLSHQVKFSFLVSCLYFCTWHSPCVWRTGFPIWNCKQGMSELIIKVLILLLLLIASGRRCLRKYLKFVQIIIKRVFDSSNFSIAQELIFFLPHRMMMTWYLSINKNSVREQIPSKGGRNKNLYSLVSGTTNKTH